MLWPTVAVWGWVIVCHSWPVSDDESNTVLSLCLDSLSLLFSFSNAKRGNGSCLSENAIELTDGMA